MPMAPAYHESLPYIDPEPSADALAAARALISAEQSSSTAQDAPAPPAPPSFSPAVQAELSRIAAGAAPAPLDLSRYEAQEEPPASPGRLPQVLAGACVSGAYLAGRLQNLALLDRWGRNAWLVGNAGLEAELRAVEAELAAARAQIDVVNVRRRARQEEVRGELEMLDKGWREGVGRALETEIAVEEMKKEIREELRRRTAQEPQQEAQ